MYNNISKIASSPRGKIIRDAIHGDIFVPDKFLAIIDTPEFQRLRRIKQLSIANSVFPSADHTRFSHCLGTFYIMTLMIEHFEKNFREMGIKITEEEKEISLLAALLHDIGHGPFSHAFENIHPDSKKNISHEEWTNKIILSKGSSINAAIIKNFGPKADEKTASLISKQCEAKSMDKYGLERIDLFSVLSSLISSQLDADRLDYLLRDSIHCGVNFGKIDIERIISSMQITVYKNKYFVCIPEKFLQDIESYLLARYQMQKVVYYHDFKIQIEQLIKQIFSRAYSLYNTGKLNFCPHAITKLFTNNLTVKDYITLDDSTFICSFQEWSLCDDKILSVLCKTFLNREKSNKINALDNSDHILNMFKNDICKLFNKYQYEISNLQNEHFWIENKTGFSAYKIKKDNIWMLRNNGTVVDLSQISKIIKKIDKEEIIWKDNRNILFINYNILKEMPIVNVDNLLSELKCLISNYDIRKTIEIEKKYYFNNLEIFDKTIEYIKSQEVFQYCIGELKNQVDYYYDTINNDLRKRQCTLRIRKIDNKYELTIKKPVFENIELSTQSERFEFQKQIENDKLDNGKEFILEHLDFLSSIENLQISLIIKNERKPIILKKGKIEFEMVFDQVQYKNSYGKSVNDFQIEIELKSDYQHRVNLKMLTDDIENSVNGLIVSNTSKYLRGLELLSKE